MIDDTKKESFERIAETQGEIKDAIVPMLETQEKLSEGTCPQDQTLVVYKTNLLLFNSALEEHIQKLQRSVLESAKLQSPSFAFEIINRTNLSVIDSIADSLKKVIDSLSSFEEKLKTPVLNWLCNFNFSPITEVLKNYQIDSNIRHHTKELEAFYLQIMSETKWFPYASCLADIFLFQEMSEIIVTSRGASKNREKRIDKAILSYYTNAKINRIKKAWWDSDMDHCIRKSLSQAINSFLRGEYVLTISCLSTMWEGLIYVKANDVDLSARKRQNMEKTKKELEKLAEYNDYESVFSEYFKKFIVSNCNGVNDVIDGVPNRHGAAHGWYRKYPNKKAALNAILLTDFIINLKPIEQTEE